MKTIAMKLKLDGSVQIEAKGFTDSSCKDATKAIEQALGGHANVEDKPEAHIHAQGAQQQHNYEY